MTQGSNAPGLLNANFTNERELYRFAKALPNTKNPRPRLHVKPGTIEPATVSIPS